MVISHFVLSDTHGIVTLHALIMIKIKGQVLVAFLPLDVPLLAQVLHQLQL